MRCGPMGVLTIYMLGLPVHCLLTTSRPLGEILFVCHPDQSVFLSDCDTL